MHHRTVPFVLACLAAAANAQGLPAQFDHDRIYFVANAPDRSILRFHTDTGGGWNAIGRSTSERLHLRAAGQIQIEGGKTSLVDFPAFLKRAGIPAPSSEPWLKGHLAVAPDETLLGADGFLGSRWFAGGIWRIDYPGRSFSSVRNWSPALEDHPVALGFRSDKDGKRAFNFPRVAITVAGRPIDVLLDTGATVKLTDIAAAAFQAKPGTLVGASYIVTSIFEEWQTTHPSWRVIAQADLVTGRVFPMIEVPEVSIADVTFGPVWFTQRPDAEFRERMSQMMDKQIDGAIGGSGLKYLRIVLDYPGAIAYVQMPRGGPAQSR